LQVLAISIHPGEFCAQCCKLPITFLGLFLQLGTLLNKSRQFLAQLVVSALIVRRIANLCQRHNFLLECSDTCIHLFVLPAYRFHLDTRGELLGSWSRIRTELALHRTEGDLTRFPKVIIRHVVAVDSCSVRRIEIVDAVVVTLEDQLCMKRRYHPIDNLNRIVGATTDRNSVTCKCEKRRAFFLRKLDTERSHVTWLE
jgi:hypothetical protein